MYKLILVFLLILTVSCGSSLAPPEETSQDSIAQVVVEEPQLTVKINRNTSISLYIISTFFYAARLLVFRLRRRLWVALSAEVIPPRIPCS